MSPSAPTLPPVHLVLLAGGRGERCGGEVPKQFASTARGPLFSLSLANFLEGAPEAGYRIGAVVVTAAARHRDTVAGVLDTMEPRVRWRLASPGATRTASTRSALDALAELDPDAADLVAVHDAARPFASAALLGALARSAAVRGGAVPGVPVPDTVIEDGPQGVTYLRRDALRAVQTPQVFRWDLLDAAHRRAAAEDLHFTDDGGLLAYTGSAPAVVPGEAGNWKVTTAGDLRRALDLING